MPVTFKVNDVEVCSSDDIYIMDEPQYPRKTRYLTSGVLVDEGAKSNFDHAFVKGPCEDNHFISTVSYAFDRHIPLSLRPEHFWAIITQTVSIHVNENAEKLRDKFVTHQGKEVIKVRRDDFVLDQPNDWASVIPEFSSEIKKRTVGGVSDLVIQQFSSTQPEETLSFQATLMGICKNYFEYTVKTRCGFPSITLEGTVDDWVKLKNASAKLINDKTLPVFSKKYLELINRHFDKFIEQFNSPEVDVNYWESMCKRNGAYGSGQEPYYEGWIFHFMNMDNILCVKESKMSTGTTDVPIIWEYYDTNINLTLKTGFVGVKYVNNVVSPSLGWYILK